MKSRFPSVLSALVLPLMWLFTTACSAEEAGSGSGAADPHAGHSHDSTGPHGGQIIDVGTKALNHLEAVHDHDNKQLTIYVLGADAKSPFPIPKAPQVKFAADPKPIVLDGQPQNAKDGKSAEFLFQGEILGGHDEGRVTVEIAGKAYHPMLEHKH